MTISAGQSSGLFTALEQLGPSDHLCWIYESQQEHFAVAIPFMRIGLDRGEKCIYIADDETIRDFREALQSERVDVDRAIASGALVLTTKEQGYLKHGSFNPDWMFTFWKETIASAMSEGFSALRATGETEWVLRDSVGLERWMEYENRMTHMLAENNCFLLCQYNRQTFPPDFILNVIRTHQNIVYANTVCRNLYHVPPEACVKTDQSAREVERLLTNIREREQLEQIRREQESQLLLAQELLVQGISRRKRAEALLSAEKHTLQMIAEGAVLPDVLDALCGAIDEQSPGLMSMVCMIDANGQHLRPIAGPRVPEGWKRAMPPTHIGPCAGSCGTAAFRVQPVVVSDIATDSLWEECRDAAMSYGLRACWSSPLVSTTGNMLGTFAMYYPEPRNPGDDDLTLMERATQVARIAIERELVRKTLHDTQQRFRLMVEGVKDYAIFMLDTEGRVTTWNDGAERIKGYREEEILGQHFSRFYPLEEVAQGKPEKKLALAAATGRVEEEGWRLRKDGARFWANTVITAVRDEEDKLIGFSKVTRDMTERKQAEERLRRSEAYLAEGQKLSHTGSWAWNLSLGEIFWSQEVFRIFGLDPAQTKPSFEIFIQSIHPEDRPSVEQIINSAIRERTDYETEFRIVLPDGSIKHIHGAARPVINESGNFEFIGSVMDVTERHLARAVLEEAFTVLKDRLYHENVALREEIDRASMFEEIVGSSQALKSLLLRVAKVAPMDSTVLISGETGTGKELIARAIHKRSKRATGPFVAFNCAGIPSTLIASELFGYEKGAFTGAQQRRIGRFELAEGGTIFLDEIGDLPAETQISLLRVIQEREFERVGGSQPIATDVRVLAASNRDLQDAVAAGTFRLDLFYRLNVFPLEVPPLRERKEDIPMLVEYFVKRYAAKAGKKIRSIDKKTFELFRSYHWPGNIRELQNVIERSVIVCESEILSVDESWLSKTSVQPDRPSSSPLSERLLEEEKKIIESALAESKGKVSGRSGAAVKLGIPSSTLESKIKTLKINKHRFSSE